MATIAALNAREILDSRGIPTIEVNLWLDNNIRVTSSVPSGTSTGKNEATEIRDGDQSRFMGMGVLKAVANINQTIAPQIIGQDPSNQGNVDQILVNLDGTTKKSRLGANAILGVSIAACKAGAASYNLPLYEYLSLKYQLTTKPYHLPTPMFNVINGGKHGAGNLDFQEFHVTPSTRYPFSKSLQMGVEVYHALEQTLIQNNAIHSTGVEGGFAPNLYTNLDALEIIREATKQTPYNLGQDIFLGLDIAASHFYKNKKYTIKDRSQEFTAQEFIEYYKKLNQDYNVFSLEDPLDESDWKSWKELTTQMSQNTLIIGDDLISTNKNLLKKAISEKACTAVVIKPNQIGTITETVEVCKIAREAKLQLIASHRSGETNDTFIADFAVGIGTNYAKFGAPARGERIIKYNRLLQIESETQVGGLK